jgi:hypothetical protein
MAQRAGLRNRPIGLRRSAMTPTHAAKQDRRALAALLAVFALLVQALIPGAAMAGRMDPAGTTIICTATGTQTLAPDGKPAGPRKPGFGGMPCQDCLAAAMAVVSPAPAPSVRPVAYAIARVEHAPVRSVLAPRARAPPRPPGQGPPTA